MPAPGGAGLHVVTCPIPQCTKISAEKYVQNGAQYSLLAGQYLRIKDLGIAAIGAGDKKIMVVLDVEQLAEAGAGHGQLLDLGVGAVTFGAFEPIPELLRQVQRLRLQSMSGDVSSPTILILPAQFRPGESSGRPDPSPSSPLPPARPAVAGIWPWRWRWK